MKVKKAEGRAKGYYEGRKEPATSPKLLRLKREPLQAPEKEKMTFVWRGVCEDKMTRQTLHRAAVGKCVQT